MSEVLNWIGKNLSMGGIVGNAIKLVGKATKYIISGIGHAISMFYDAENEKNKIKNDFNYAGDITDRGFSITGSMLGFTINKGIELTGKGAGGVAGTVARVSGASEETIVKTEQIANIVATVAVGAVAGMGIAGAAVAASAAAGTAGAAATTSGLAALGGGSIAAGGGGMAAGQAIVNGIVAASSASAVATKCNE